MFIQHQFLFKSIRICVYQSFPIKYWIYIMNYTVMIRAHDDLITGIVIQALYKVVDMMCLCYMGSIGFSDQLSANLTTISIKQFQIISDLLVQLTDLDDLLRLFQTCRIICNIKIKFRL